MEASPNVAPVDVTNRGDCAHPMAEPRHASARCRPWRIRGTPSPDGRCTSLRSDDVISVRERRHQPAIETGSWRRWSDTGSAALREGSPVVLEVPARRPGGSHDGPSPGGRCAFDEVARRRRRKGRLERRELEICNAGHPSAFLLGEAREIAVPNTGPPARCGSRPGPCRDDCAAAPRSVAARDRRAVRAAGRDDHRRSGTGAPTRARRSGPSARRRHRSSRQRAGGGRRL